MVSLETRWFPAEEYGPDPLQPSAAHRSLTVADTLPTSSTSRVDDAETRDDWDSATATTGSSFWNSEWSEWSSELGDDTALMISFIQQKKESMLKDLLNDFLVGYGHGGQATSGSSKSGTAKETSSMVKVVSASRADESAQKRKRQPEDDDEDESSNAPSRTVRRRTRIPSELTFACPFSKKDPLRHAPCYRYVLTRIRDVKQHLVRRHGRPIYCPRCGDIFSSEDLRDEHCRQSICAIQSVLKIDGISESQRRLLGKKTSPNMSPEEQWFSIFDILFPGHQPRPVSAYADHSLSEELAGFRDYMTSQGPPILAEHLTRAGLFPPESEPESTSIQNGVLAEGLDLLIRRWVSALPQASSRHPSPPIVSTPNNTLPQTIASRPSSRLEVYLAGSEKLVEPLTLTSSAAPEAEISTSEQTLFEEHALLLGQLGH